jgi:hypothetical protein
MCGLHKAKLNSTVRDLMQPLHQHFASMGTAPCIPHLLWKDGVTSDLPAKSKIGITFTIVILSFQEDGKKLFTPMTQQNVPSLSNVAIILGVVEMICLFLEIRGQECKRSGTKYHQCDVV